jgi:S-adenosylmethionine:tRNA ribosyltransferase-isomerase
VGPEDFDYPLPETLIARHPLPERDGSRLLVLSRRSGHRSHHHFRELPELLKPGDLLVLNDARVFPARLVGRKIPTGGRVELLLIRPAEAVETNQALENPPSAHDWLCLGQASKGLKAGAQLEFAGLQAEVIEALGEGEYRVRFFAAGTRSLAEWLRQTGELPLPPYLNRAPQPEDEARYQTVFAAASGSAAAPTAGLHFTPATFAALEQRQVEIVRLTLDVGPGTFLPVRGALEAHRMHEERYHLPEPVAEAVRRARADGRRVVAAGTTVVRALESATDPAGQLHAGQASTRLFIRPGFAFRQVDALLTNFHLPRSTLLMLVAAFAGREPVLRAYAEAVTKGYRFFSYGDAMLIQ